ncbi:hypothetical protein EA462_04735 [Natrarchaeobius halalkaliphilus]|uniref:Uncharacterized protein n=1 Tax=Natrarchaeobius halalkaliphilus TaxID=1679091 RepID=A0A3N6LS26_9EURY|nr:hypothetical protein [Natrarchaeobius halalkaliphilus]RQG91297.1 hypothetical protein EA462_04735 [Natrarchaeobius halalkaliphilus]
MSVRQSFSFVELFLTAPAKSALLGFGPIALALGQLLNSYLNGVSPAVAICFAAVMIGFAVIATGHHAAEVRLQSLEADLES